MRTFPISNQPPPVTHIRLRQFLSLLCLIAAGILLLVAVLPTSTWRDVIVRSSSWGALDDRDLRYMRVVFAGFGLVALMWSIVFSWKPWLSRHVTEEIGKYAYRGILLVLTLCMGYFLAKLFIVFHDSVRITGPKTQFSNWGEFLGKTWTVPFQPYTDRDYFNSMFLAFAGLICLVMMVLRGKGFATTRKLDFPRTLWGLLAFGFLYASVDELVMIHEFLGPNLPFVRALHVALGITKYPDDLIMMAYAGSGVIVFLIYIRHFTARKSAFAVFVLAMIFQGLAAANGLPGLYLNEESFEMYGGLCYFVSMFWYAYCEIEESLEYYKGLGTPRSISQQS